MPAETRRLTRSRRYKPKDLAVARIDGRDVYLGTFNSTESREKSRSDVAEWLTREAAIPRGGAAAKAG